MMATFMTRLIVLHFAALAAGAPSARQDGDVSNYVQQALAASQQGNVSKALSLATRAIELSRTQPQGWLLRARLYDGRRDYAKALADYSEVVKLDPKGATAWQRRGEANFKMGKIAESIADFDKYLTLSPDQKPYHWQRGISLYYAGRFAEGKQQFELHQTVNPHDVENAVWHFLCNARANGLDAAKKGLIPIEGDARVPMAQVHALFAGKATTEDVMKAAHDTVAHSGSNEALFYANLYLGLYYEAIGEGKKAQEFISKAAERSKENGYMGDVARIHAEILRKRRNLPQPLLSQGGGFSWRARGGVREAINPPTPFSQEREKGEVGQWVVRFSCLAWDAGVVVDRRVRYVSMPRHFPIIVDIRLLY